MQSQPEVRDGVVIFLNLEPENLRHGQLAVVAGATHYDGGNLPQHELERITDEMRAVLGDGETAAGIATGLEMIANSLVYGPAPPPEPSRAEQLAADAARGPLSILNLLSVLAVAAIGFVGFRIWSSRPNTNGPVTRTTQPPDDLIPAAAGALVTGRISDMQMEATILDLARRGALAVEPEDGKKKVQIRLIDAGVVANELELQTWNALDTEANVDRIVTSKKLSKVRSHWQPAKDALQLGLESRGWYEPDAGRQRRPAYIAGAVALVLAVVVFVITVIGEQPWGFVGVGLLAAAGLAAIGVGMSYADTTAEGEARAQAWRGYAKGLKDVGSNTAVELDLDEAVPYAVSMNAKQALDKRLKQASEAGYSPLWLGRSLEVETWGAVGFYPYWTTFHAGVSPSVGAGSSGASAGSGGAGGGF